MNVVPVAATVVDWKSLNHWTREALGSPLGERLDRQGIPPTSPTSLRKLIGSQQGQYFCNLVFFVNGPIEIEYLYLYGTFNLEELSSSRSSWTGLVNATFDTWSAFSVMDVKEPGLHDLSLEMRAMLRRL